MTDGRRRNDVEVVRPGELSSADRAAWRVIVSASQRFASPFFHPDYAVALSEFRPQVEIAVIRKHDELIGFFPYERHPGDIGRPLGIKLADFQGAVVHDGRSICCDDLLPGARLRRLHFDHLLADQTSANGTLDTVESPFMELSEGYSTYVAGRRAQGSGLPTQTLRKRRKLEREAGSVTFQWHDPDPAAFERLWAWKSAQRRRTQTVDILDFEWVRSFLTRIGQIREDGLYGAVSTLRVNERIIAVHLGMHTHGSFHYWIPAYDAEYGLYSPGSILLMCLAEACAERGISRIDLGKGNDRYKESFASGSTPVATGTADRSTVRRLMRLSAYRMTNWIKSSPLRSVAQLPKRLLRRWQTKQWMRPL